MQPFTTGFLASFSPVVCRKYDFLVALHGEESIGGWDSLEVPCISVLAVGDLNSQSSAWPLMSGRLSSVIGQTQQLSSLYRYVRLQWFGQYFLARILIGNALMNHLPQTWVVRHAVL